MSQTNNKLAQGVEVLISRLQNERKSPDFDVLIIGSGYGAAVAASRLARVRQADGSKLSVCVLERGREYLPGDFPDSLAALPGEIRFQRASAKEAQGNAQGLFDLHLNDDVSILRANGLGGGSLINAGVVEEMAAAIWQEAAWPDPLRQNAAAFEPYYQRVISMLGATVDAGAWRKTRQLQRLGNAIDRLTPGQPVPASGHSFRSVRLALNLKQGINPHGIAQRACVGCGDCFSGCNFNAKNTLCTNYLPDAKHFGAEIFTGATVLSVEKQDSAGQALWLVHFGLSDSPTSNARRRRYQVSARMVVLAAGTLGSTEILMRSRRQGSGLPLSSCLGTRFSGNGDMIWAGFRQDQPVQPGAEEHSGFASREVGPTISAMLDLRHHRDNPVVIQDAAIPASMYRLFGEIITTGAVLHRMAQWNQDGATPPQHDPDAINPRDLTHTAVYLTMQRDSASGKMEFIADGAQAGCIRVHWPEAALALPLAATEQVLQRGVKALHGMLIPAPLWRAYPQELAPALGSKPPKGGLLTVHPLGGCPMGNTHWQGVVNHAGAVFDCVTGTSVHPGLYVWDGAIIPLSIGINPLLTISALTERAVELCAVEQGWQLDLAPWQCPAPTAPMALPEMPAPPAMARSTVFKFTENMRGTLQVPGERQTPPVATAARNQATPGLQVNFLFDMDIPAFLLDRQRRLIISDAILTQADGSKIAMSGHVEWLHLAPGAALGKAVRGALSYAKLRAWPDLQARKQRLAKAAHNATHYAAEKPPANPAENAGSKVASSGLAAGDPGTVLPGPEVESVWKMLAGLGRLASHTGGQRILRYVLRPKYPASHSTPGSGWHLVGEKRVQYVPGNNLWRSLSDLDTKILDASGNTLQGGVLRLDWMDLLNNHGMQLLNNRENVYAWQDLASMAAFFVRSVFRIHFWSLRKPDYPQEKRRFPRPGDLPGLAPMEKHVLEVAPLPDCNNPPAPAGRIELSHYRAHAGTNPGTNSDTNPGTNPGIRSGPHPGSSLGLPPVILIHGFGASGLQYTSPLMPESLTQYLCRHGREVWVLDLRTSVALPGSQQPWSLDEIAQNDIPAAVRHVLAQYHGAFTALDVVAHCIGSAMFNIAVLSGRLQNEAGASLIRAAVMLQVGPLFKVSPSNRIRGAAARQMRDQMDFDSMDSSMDETSADWQAILLDRLLATHPLPAQEMAKLHTPWFTPLRTDLANYYRSTGVFGRLFEIDNISAPLRNGLGDLLGPTNLRTYQQILHAVLQDAVVDEFGRNIYLTDRNLASFYRFPALFLHGSGNDVFERAGPEESAAILNQVVSPGRFRFMPLDGFGHLDPLIGIGVAEKVFKPVCDFLAASKPLASPLFATAPAQGVIPATPAAALLSGTRCQPELGPILGWTRAASQPASSALVCRLWLKAKELRQPCRMVETLLLDAAGKVVPDSYQAHKVLDIPRFTIAVCDVTLPDHAAYTILLTCRYEAPLLAGEVFEPATPLPTLTPALPTLASMLAAVEHDCGPLELSVAAHRQTCQPQPSRQSGQFQQSRAPEQSRQCQQQLEHLWSAFPEKFARATLAPAARQAAAQVLPPASAEPTLCLALGSCRYSGSNMEIEAGDAAFAHLLAHLDQTEEQSWQPALLLLMGDQIYLDATAGVMERRARPELVLERYQEAWSSPAAAQLLARLPGYMMLDDHEIKNDWEPASDEAGIASIRAEQLAQAAFVAFQWAHSPRNPAFGPQAADPRARGLWYEFESGGFPFFMMDTRLEREARHPGAALPAGLPGPTIVSPTQMAALANWMARCQAQYGDRPKFIVSPSALAPVLSEHAGLARSQCDGWYAYPRSIRDLQRNIFATGCINPVMLAGDLHASFACKISLHDASGARASLLSLVFSPQYAPYGFINTRTGDTEAQWQEFWQDEQGSHGWEYERLWDNDHYQGFGLIRVEQRNGQWHILLGAPLQAFKTVDITL